MSLKTIKTKHTLVARLLAMGHDLQDICTAYTLNYRTWQEIVREPLFATEVKRLQEKIEDRIIEDVANDPILAELNMGTLESAKQLRAEVTFDGEGSSSATRIRAANSLLDKCGYGVKNKDEKPTQVNVILSDRMAKAIEDVVNV